MSFAAFIARSRAAEVKTESKKRKRSEQNLKMPGFFSTLSSRHLKPPPAPSRKPSERLVRTEAANEVDDFLSSDFEHSFASTMSLNSPPGSPPTVPAGINLLSPNAMDISPAPPASKIFKADNGSSIRKSRPRAFTVARMFGKDVVNHETASSPHIAVDDVAAAIAANKSAKRPTVPNQWLGVFSRPEDEHVRRFVPNRLTFDLTLISFGTSLARFTLAMPASPSHHSHASRRLPGAGLGRDGG